MPGRKIHHVIRWAIAIAAMILPACAFAQADDEDEPEFRPGLVAHYTAADGTSVTRLDSDVQFQWRDGSPDLRLPIGKFSATWQGRLFTIASGKYQLHVYAAGRVRVALNSKVVLETTAEKPTWLPAMPADLTYGHHPLEITYEPGTEARIGLFWSGPQFQLEPVPDRHLFHDPKQTPDGRFEQGQLLVRALRCASCHEIPHEQAALTAPALTHLAGNLSPDWLIDWLTGKNLAATTNSAAESSVAFVPRRMPHFELTPDDARAIGAYLFSVSQPAPKVNVPPKPREIASEEKKSKAEAAPKNTDPKKKPKEKPRTEPSRVEGEKLVNTLGCLACHRLGERGTHNLFGGGDLTQIAAKRPADFFSRWLDHPESINPAHRMPVFRLSPLERADLALFLGSLGTQVKEKSAVSTGPELIERGRKLSVEHRCGACHQLTVPTTQVAKTRLAKGSRWDASCLGRAGAKPARPGYQLSKKQREAVQHYLLNVKPAEPNRSPALDGAFVLAERNCLACHARGSSPGIAASLNAVTKADPSLAPLLPALAPPALLGVGDKLTDEALAAAIELKNPPLRPWLMIRMPKFNLSADEMTALKGYLISHDRIPDLPPPATKMQSYETARKLAGSRLVTADGFGCTSCHQIGSSIPTKATLAARGTDLSLVGSRLRRPWYDRWVRNPARIVPRMEMPAILLPVRGVLHDNLPEQLTAVWEVLNTPGFEPPLPSPVRVVRARNLPGVTEPASVLTDNMEIGKTVFRKPLVIGLPNRHNILFDLETNRLAAWWIGDTGRERTRAKAWYWEAGGEPLWPLAEGVSEIRIHSATDKGLPIIDGSFVTDLDSFERIAGGVKFSYRLRFKFPGEPSSKTVHVTQTFTAIPAGSAGTTSGFRRKIECSELPPGQSMFVYGFAKTTAVLTGDSNSIKAERLPGRPRVRAVSPDFMLPDFSEGAGAFVTITNTKRVDDTVQFNLDYLVDLPVDQFPVEPPKLPPLPVVKLNTLPGFEAVQLPLPTDEMPTGLAWRPDGTLVMSSLKGRVCLVRDSDGDGLEDTIAPFSDDLAAPYGVAAHGDEIDVINKYGLLRLYDRDRDGRAERTEVIASGWGYTTDYHDWAVGLPRDAEGNYYVGLPCQQDNRTPAEAHLRGTTLRLIPRQPTSDDPRLYSLDPISAGLRFPMGLALNRAGDLFATDNQGNYNPFNELNHLSRGERYGFINKLDVKPGFSPPFRAAAIDLPHPWTRSVNGICFLYTPPKVREKLGRDLFGPFEGHLVGCEYTTLQLIRMSVERVGDTYQGAAYPLSVAPAEGEPTFEGPTVCEISPTGDLYVGNLHDSGWGGGQNTGSIVRVRPTGKLPLGIAEVRARASGFAIDFTGPVSAEAARNPKNYALLAYRRISTPAYGGSNVDEHTPKVVKAEPGADSRQVTLTLDGLRKGFVYEIRVVNLSPSNELFHPAEAYYTLRKIPEK
jgi:mono/diheme cytochrome c family protein